MQTLIGKRIVWSVKNVCDLIGKRIVLSVKNVCDWGGSWGNEYMCIKDWFKQILPVFLT